MTKVSKGFKIVLTITLLLLAFFSSLGVTYSYFTASSHKQGVLTFGDLEVGFVVKNAGASVSPNTGTTTVTLYPYEGAIVRGQEFTLSTTPHGSLSHVAIDKITIESSSLSAKSYVRFWIDAYVVDSNGNVDYTTNYGKYFFLYEDEDTAEYYVRGGSNSSHEEGSSCYFLAYELFPGIGNSVSLGNKMTFKDWGADAIPADVLGKKLRVTLSLQAVQSANQAFKSVFNDNKGYYNSSNWS